MAGKQKWSQGIIDEVCALRSDGLEVKKIAAAISLHTKISGSQVAGLLHAYFNGAISLKGHKAADSDHERDDNFMERVSMVVQYKKKSPDKLSLDEIFDTLEEAQGFRKKVSIRQLEAEVEIKTDRPIAITFISDVHIGSPYTNYEVFRRDLSIIKSHPQIYVMKGGDWSNKFMPQFKDKSAVTGEIVPAQLQLLMVERIMKDIEPSIIAAIGGNHDRMDEKQTGISSEYFIHRDRPFPYMPQGGLVKLTVGTQTYRVLWKHDYRFNSALNQFNSHHRMLELLSPTADIIALEHVHNPGMESVERGSFDDKRTVISVRTGAYKEADPYSVDYFKAGVCGPQTIILYPDRKKMLGLHGTDALSDAKIYLDGIKLLKPTKR